MGITLFILRVNLVRTVENTKLKVDIFYNHAGFPLGGLGYQPGYKTLIYILS